MRPVRQDASSAPFILYTMVICLCCCQHTSNPMNRHCVDISANNDTTAPCSCCRSQWSGRTGSSLLASFGPGSSTTGLRHRWSWANSRVRAGSSDSRTRRRHPRACHPRACQPGSSPSRRGGTTAFFLARWRATRWDSCSARPSPSMPTGRRWLAPRACSRTTPTDLRRGVSLCTAAALRVPRPPVHV